MKERSKHRTFGLDLGLRRTARRSNITRLASAFMVLLIAWSPAWGKEHSESSNDWNQLSNHGDLWGSQDFSLSSPFSEGWNRYSGSSSKTDNTHRSLENFDVRKKSDGDQSSSEGSNGWWQETGASSWNLSSSDRHESDSSGKESNEHDLKNSRDSDDSSSASTDKSKNSYSSGDHHSSNDRHSSDDHDSSGDHHSFDDQHSSEHQGNKWNSEPDSWSHSDRDDGHGSFYNSDCNHNPCGCPPQNVPEPGSAALLAGLASIVCLRRRRPGK